ncbi:hypothetical protein [Streptomyces sp. NBC_01190]|uniref:COG4315 family predicted lipoprotein n=1 Tax=Streptomyces sp. NBC_01190 TaxID=2903767 RepID=UPI003868DDF7|nr:hypothetical protein OG519_04735 [Streptomyces sp. NBC_01190]
MRHHARASIAVAGAVLVATAATACSDGTQSSAGSGITPPATTSASATDTDGPAAAGEVAAASNVTVKSKKGPLGTILFTSKTQALYLFQADKTSKSTCNGACSTAWPPLTVSGKPTAGSGIKSDLLSTTTRGDGSKQVTYNGHPLYRFAGDKKAGSTNGQGLNAFGALWYVVGTNGKEIKSKPSSTSGTGGGSGY